MLLEVNRLVSLVVDRPPIEFADTAIWSQLARYRIALLCNAGEVDAWKAILSGEDVVMEYDHDQTYGAQANIRLALEYLNSEPYDSAYVCFSPANLKEAINTRIGTIQIGESVAEAIPDVFLRSFPSALAEIDNTSSLSKLGFIAETIATVGGGSVSVGGGQVLWAPRFFSALDHIRYREELNDVRLLLLGRYFPTEDARHGKHQLSRRMWHMKQMDLYGVVFASIVGGGLNVIDQREPPVNVITRVPPKPSKADHDHLEWILNLACARADRKFHSDPTFSSRVEYDLLRRTCEYQCQKDARSYQNLAANVAGAFRAGRQLDGEHVVLLDDIITSGSTTAECARMLLNAGAEKVTVVAIARNQRIIGGIPAALPCSNARCNGELELKPGSDAQFFWGCSNWSTRRCKETKNWRSGIVAHNRLNTRDDIPYDEDIEF